MADGVELIPVNDQDVEEAVFRAWEDGKGPQALAREFALSVTQVEQILDRMLPVFDAQNQLRATRTPFRRFGPFRGGLRGSGASGLGAKLMACWASLPGGGFSAIWACLAGL